MKKIYILFLSLVTMFSCTEEDIPTASTLNFEGETINISVPENAINFEETITVYASKAASVDRVFNLVEVAAGTTLSADSYNLPATVTVPANQLVGEFVISLTDVVDGNDNITFDNKSIEVKIEESNNTFMLSGTAFVVTQACTDTIVDLDITTDAWPDETTWELYDLDNGNVLINQGGPFDLASATITIQFCLSSGSYGVVVRDSFGDGIVGGGFVVSIGSTVLASGGVGPSASPGDIPSLGSAIFTVP